MQKGNSFQPKNKRRCYIHFEEEQYGDMMHALVTITQPKKLNKKINFK